MFLDAIFLIAKILAVIAVTIAGVTLLYLLVDFIFNCLAERQDVEASIIGVEKEKDFYHHPIFTGLITVFSHFEEEKAYVCSACYLKLNYFLPLKIFKKQSEIA